VSAEVELLVVGAGPAGLAAASEATAAGVPTLLVDAADATGGQYYARPPGGGFDDGLPRELTAGARPELLDLRLRTAVWGAFGDAVALVCDGRSELVRPAAVVIATGAIERPLPFPGWDRPGVVAPGALQRLLKVSSVVPEGRIVVSGSGPFLLAVASELRAAGADVHAVVERRTRRQLATLGAAVLVDGARRREALRFGRRLRGVQMRFGAGVRSADGAGLTLTDGTRIAADVTCVGHGFLSRTELARLLGVAIAPGGGIAVDAGQGTGRAGVFAAGEATGIGGALLAAAEGRMAGRAAARHLGRLDAANHEHDRRLATARDRHSRFARRLALAYPDVPVLDAATPETTICRCEHVTLAALRGAAALPVPADDPRAAKAELRCGMGSCQGAMCAESVRAATSGPGELAERRLPRARPPLAPITIEEIAAGAERGV
jgi:NADPH-dependent 2,4-dienoyl-CoA reductase/sulfur reductase-like enzyme